MTTVKELNRFGRLMEARVENGNSDLNVLLSLSSKGRMNSGINTRHTIWVILGVARIIRSRLCLFYIERRPNNFFSGEFSLLYRLERILKLPGRRIFDCFYPKLFSLPAACLRALLKLSQSSFLRLRLHKNWKVEFQWKIQEFRGNFAIFRNRFLLWLYSAIVVDYSNKN